VNLKQKLEGKTNTIIKAIEYGANIFTIFGGIVLNIFNTMMMIMVLLVIFPKEAGILTLVEFLWIVLRVYIIAVILSLVSEAIRGAVARENLRKLEEQQKEEEALWEKRD
jgi:ABC-type transport system involved in Fe-S cluster assembly fused permease/ATPase subunit